MILVSNGNLWMCPFIAQQMAAVNKGLYFATSLESHLKVMNSHSSHCLLDLLCSQLTKIPVLVLSSIYHWLHTTAQYFIPVVEMDCALITAQWRSCIPLFAPRGGNVTWDDILIHAGCLLQAGRRDTHVALVIKWNGRVDCVKHYLTQSFFMESTNGGK